MSVIIKNRAPRARKLTKAHINNNSPTPDETKQGKRPPKHQLEIVKNQQKVLLYNLCAVGVSTNYESIFGLTHVNIITCNNDCGSLRVPVKEIVLIFSRLRRLISI